MRSTQDSRRPRRGGPGLRVFAAAIAFVAAAADGRAETLSQRVDRYARPTLEKSATDASRVSIHAGRFDLFFKSGALARVFVGDEPIGFFFHGDGSWTYASDTPDEFPVMRHDAAEATRWKAVDDGTGRLLITDTFRDFLWIAPGSRIPAGSKVADVPEKEFRKHLETFARRKTDHVAQRLAYRSLADPTGKFVWAEFSGGKQEGLYFLDDVESHAEDLVALKKLKFDSANAPWEWTAETISDQPLGRSFREPPAPGIVLTRVEPEIEAENEHAKIRVTETFAATERPVSTLHLNLRSRVFTESALDIRKQELLRVETSDGHAVDFDHRDGRLLLALPRPLAPGQPLTLRFDMEGDVLHPPSGDSYWLLGFDPWFPQPSLFGSAFTWKCTVRVKKPFLPVASGVELFRREEGAWNVVSTEIDRPVALPVILAGRYHVEEVIKEGRTYRIASYAYVNHQATEHLATLASQIIKFYEPFLGPFPWKEFTIVEINSYGFGVAPPATMFITREAFSPHQDDYTKLFSKSLTARFAHEIAHQYWGHQIRWPDDEEEWMSESFAEYCSGLQVRAEKGDGAFRSLIRDWEGRMKESGDAATLPTANRLEGERSYRQRFGLLYGRGPFLLSVLHREVGEEKFLTFLKTFQSNRKWKTGSSALVADLLRVLGGKSYDDFFERYYWGTEQPKLAK